MGCSSSEPINYNIYTIYYCSYVPVNGKKNVYKIKLIGQEDAEKFSERKFFAQVAQHQEKEIIDFVQRKNFNKKTLFYLYFNSHPEIKNLYQMIDLIPDNHKFLNKVVLVSTEEVVDFNNFLIVKKTKNLEFHKLIKNTLDLNDTSKTLETVNDINITKDGINYGDKDENEENDEIFINGLINEEKLNNIKVDYNKGLKKLSLSEISINNINNKCFSELIKYILNKDIKQFSLSNTNINENNLFYIILDLFEQNYNIRSIVLHNCNLMDKYLNNFMLAISDKRIRYLNLSKNVITVEGASWISEFLLANKTLQELNLSHNDNTNFKAEGIKYIMRSLAQSPNIKLINLSGMNITGCGEFIANVIEVSQTLETLIMENDYLNTNDFKNIFEKIKINNIMKEIDVSYNDMGGDKSLEYIRDSIKMNNSLKKIKLDKININNDNYSIIFEGIENNKNINSYSLSYNKINPKIVLEFFIKQLHVKELIFIPFDKNNPEDKNKDLNLDEKKLLEKCKEERSDMDIIVLNN